MQLLADWNPTQPVVEPDDSHHHENDRDLDKYRQQVLINGECVISFPGASQYTEGRGVSACGIAALNCVRVIFNKEQQGLKDAALLTEIMSRETMEVSISFAPINGHEASIALILTCVPHICRR
jgi:hypothetical protein